jgi:hypothetical protein
MKRTQRSTKCTRAIENTPLKSFLIALVVMLLTPAAHALDLTGTWDTANGNASKCKVIDQFGHRSGGLLSVNPLHISQSGTSIHIATCNGTCSPGATKLSGLAITSDKDPEKGSAVATSCSPTASEAGSLYIKKAKVDASGGKISGTFNMVWVGSEIRSCAIHLVRTDPTDPGVTGCP